MVIVKVNEYNSFSLFKHPSQKIVQQIHTRYSLSFRMLWWWRSQLRFIQPSIFRDHDIRAPNGRYYDSLKLLHQEFDSIFFFFIMPSNPSDRMHLIASTFCLARKAKNAFQSGSRCSSSFCKLDFNESMVHGKSKNERRLVKISILIEVSIDNLP